MTPHLKKKHAPRIKNCSKPALLHVVVEPEAHRVGIAVALLAFADEAEGVVSLGGYRERLRALLRVGLARHHCERQVGGVRLAGVGAEELDVAVRALGVEFDSYYKHDAK